MSAPQSKRKWIVALSVTFGTLMGALDTSIVAVATPHLRGALGSTVEEMTWVTTGFVIATVIVMPLTAFLGRTFGQKRVYMFSLALFTTSVVLSIATIANNNLQDLKTGQLVHATPWRQQWALVIGCVVGAAVIPPVLDLLQHAYGFAGAPLDARFVLRAAQRPRDRAQPLERDLAPAVDAVGHALVFRRFRSLGCR